MVKQAFYMTQVFGFTGYAVAENIKKCLGERPLDYIFLTHSHYDHALGSAYILRHYPNAKVVAGKYAVDIFKRDGTKIISYIDKKFHNKTSKRQGIPAVFKLSINQFRIYDFCGSAADVVHPSNPLHLVS